MEYSGILGVDVLRRMQARVDLRTSTLVLKRSSHRLSEQEAERCALISRQPQAAREMSGTGLITPETTELKASVETPIPGLSPGGYDSDRWEVVASGPVVLPPLSQGIVVGKLRCKEKLDIPQEILVEPVGIGTPGAYVARVASRVYTQELDVLQDLGERSENQTGTSEEKVNVEVDAEEFSGGGRVMSLQNNVSNAARYCVLKVLNTSRQLLEIGKHVRLGTAESPSAARTQGTKVRYPIPGVRRDFSMPCEFH